MGRKSKLSDNQWEEASRRVLAGESIRSVAKSLGVGDTTLRERISGTHGKIKDVANQLYRANDALKSLPIAAQIGAIDLAARLSRISEELAGAANHGAMSANRLSEIAAQQVQQIDPMKLAQEGERLRTIAALTSLANSSSTIPLNLLNANKETIRAANAGDNRTNAEMMADLVAHLPN